MNNYLLEADNVSKKFVSQYALKNVSLSLERGKIIGLLGPNGSGKTTFIKMINGLLTPTTGTINISGNEPGVETKKIVSYLPDKNYLPNWMTVEKLIDFYQDFYADFDREKAEQMLLNLNLDKKMHFKNMSKGMKEKVQLVLVMSRKAELYCLDEPIGGVDPATRDYILDTIINNYDENASVLISTHLISDIENVLDEVIFLQNGEIRLHSTVDEIREKEGKSVDALFREVFKC